MICIESGHYSFNQYVSKKRFCSYWHQIDEIIKLNPKSILEIGIGDGFVSNYLKYKEFKIVTLDIDRHLKPDYVSSVLSMPFPGKYFEVVVCFEVLEHLPYEDFCKALNEIYRVSNKHAIISLPDATKVIQLYIKIPKNKELRFLMPVPCAYRRHKFKGEHYWEIEKKDYPLNRILGDIRSCQFQLVKTYRVFEMPYHRFFVLKKI